MINKIIIITAILVLSIILGVVLIGPFGAVKKNNFVESKK